MTADDARSGATGTSRASTPDRILDAVAFTLRQQIGPQVGDPFAKTQAFMAAVVLEKLAGQLRAERTTHEAADAERRDLLAELRTLCPRPSAGLDRAMKTLTNDGDDACWSELVRALYEERDRLGTSFDPALTRVRLTLRARLDRVLAYAR